MTISDALTHTVGVWRHVLEKHVYDLTAIDTIDQAGVLRLRAERPAWYGGPATIVNVYEVWDAGPDPDSLMPTIAGHHLARGSWHAQIGGADAVHAYRVDVDRAKPTPLMLHCHPHGHTNSVREPTAISTPAAWMWAVEEVVATLYEQGDEQD